MVAIANSAASDLVEVIPTVIASAVLADAPDHLTNLKPAAGSARTATLLPLMNQPLATLTAPPGPAAVSSQTFVRHCHVTVVAFVRMNGPVFVSAPVFGALPVAVQPRHASCVPTPNAIGEPATLAFVAVFRRAQTVPTAGFGVP